MWQAHNSSQPTNLIVLKLLEYLPVLPLVPIIHILRHILNNRLKIFVIRLYLVRNTITGRHCQLF